SGPLPLVRLLLTVVRQTSDNERHRPTPEAPVRFCLTPLRHGPLIKTLNRIRAKPCQIALPARARARRPPVPPEISGPGRPMGRWIGGKGLNDPRFPRFAVFCGVGQENAEG